MAVDDQIAESFQGHIRQIYTERGITQRRTFAYKPAHSENFRDRGPAEKEKNPLSYLRSSVAFCAAVIVAATLVSNKIYAGGWSRIESMSPSNYHVAALRENGTVVANGLNNYGQCNTKRWKKITQVVTGNNFTAGLKEDGTVLVAGGSEDVFDGVSDWTDIVSLSASDTHLVGLKSDGTVVAAGSNDNGECDVDDFSDVAIIRAISNSAGSCTVIVTNSGKMDVTNNEEWSSIKLWMAYNTGEVDGGYRITKLYGSYFTFVATTEDGRCNGIGSNSNNQMDGLDGWDAREIVDIWAGNAIVALKNDGSVLFGGNSEDMSSQISQWKDIVAINGCVNHVLGLKSDGTVVASGSNSNDQLEVDTWKNVEKIYTGYRTSYGVKENGRVVAAGYGYGGMTYLSAKSPMGVLQFWRTAIDW
jgi:alpha-tubulin suppressor-like RCC1 family protein